METAGIHDSWMISIGSYQCLHTEMEFILKAIRAVFFPCYPSMMCLDRFVTFVWDMFTCRQIDNIIQSGFYGETESPSQHLFSKKFLSFN